MKSLANRSETASGLSRAARSLQVHEVAPSQTGRFDQLRAAKHYLGPASPVGDFLRQVVVRDGQWVALLVWGPAALKLKDREHWIGWNPTLAAERLKLVVQNRRFLLLHDKGREPNLASQALAAACRALPAHWQQRFSYRPLLAESFTDPESYSGTCYKASGWQPVGMGGHDVPAADRLRRFHRTLRNLVRCRELAEEIFIFENPGEMPALVLGKTTAGQEIQDATIWSQISKETGHA